ncbi:MAG: hypothetical protein DCC43_05510 [Candidatus Brocadia sp.]|nr:hypothetical protein [Candidatus Brocadia sp. AMX3]RIK01744.1 MAG: hypothetical protein DCC43_05510 [Candidatus Brocadia sp.]
MPFLFVLSSHTYLHKILEILKYFRYSINSVCQDVPFFLERNGKNIASILMERHQGFLPWYNIL